MPTYPFASATLPAGWSWHSEPARWAIVDGTLRVETNAATDFWQRTHYGFRVDNGHFLHAPLAGDGVLVARVRFAPVHQYDQAGVMIRASADCWLKASVEFEPDGPARLGAVATNAGYSDWSTQDFPPGPGEVWFRLRREADDVIVDHSRDGQTWTQLRMAHLHGANGGPLAIGVYACSPKGAGYVATFHDVTLTQGRIASS